MSRLQKPGFSVGWPVLVGAAVVGTFIVARAMPGSTAAGRLAREAEARAKALPETLRQLRSLATERLAEAKEAYRQSRAESERILFRDLEEAKRRGSLPPT